EVIAEHAQTERQQVLVREAARHMVRFKIAKFEGIYDACAYEDWNDGLLTPTLHSNISYQQFLPAALPTLRAAVSVLKFCHYRERAGTNQSIGPLFLEVSRPLPWHF
ncbi:MAG TPA: hypothetical protein VGB09_11675, partial [Candidatus Binatia bacterium]